MLELGMTLPGLRQRAAAIAALPALGLLTLAGLTPANWRISYHEAEPGAANLRRLINELALARPTLVAVSALTASILDAYSLTDALRASGGLTVIGGLHASVCPDEAAAHADAVVIGDGEPVWPDVLADAAAGRLRPRYRADRPFDLARSPVPRFDLVAHKRRPRFTLQTARGCPLACDFCGASRLLGPFREKPVECIERELGAIVAAHRARTIELADDNTFAGRRDPRPLLDVFKRAGIRWFTESDWRIGERPGLPSLLAESGCVQVLVGVESLSRRFGGMGAKAAPPARIMDAVDRIQRAGVAVIGCFVVGGDGEDHESIHALGDFLMEAPFADVQITLQTPYPGTALRARLEREGRLMPGRDWNSYTLFDLTYRPDRLSAHEMERAFRSLVTMVFADEPARRREEVRRRLWERRGGDAVQEGLSA